MSGGALNHGYWRVEELAEDLQSELRIQGESLSPMVRARLEHLVAEAQVLALKARAAEWLLSGDTGEDTFNADWAQAEEQHGLN